MNQYTEKRLSPRLSVLNAVMVTPNGDLHDAQVLDISTGGARIRLSPGWKPKDGAALRIFFLAGDDDTIVLSGHVTRVAIDHMGVAFDPAQEAGVQQLFEAIGSQS